jgi:hypothetical protein
MQAYFSSLPGVDIYTLRVTSQTSYSPEYMYTNTAKYHGHIIIRILGVSVDFADGNFEMVK